MLGRTNHILEASSDLDKWLPVANITSTNELKHFTDPDATNYPHRFYRVIAP